MFAQYIFFILLGIWPLDFFFFCSFFETQSQYFCVLPTGVTFQVSMAIICSLLVYSGVKHLTLSFRPRDFAVFLARFRILWVSSSGFALMARRNYCISCLWGGGALRRTVFLMRRAFIAANIFQTRIAIWSPFLLRMFTHQPTNSFRLPHYFSCSLLRFLQKWMWTSLRLLALSASCIDSLNILHFRTHLWHLVFLNDRNLYRVLSNESTDCWSRFCFKRQQMASGLLRQT